MTDDPSPPLDPAAISRGPATATEKAAQKRSFSAWTTAAFGITPAALLILLSDKGDGIVTMLKAVPALVSTWTQGSPIGAWALLAASLVPALITLKLDQLIGPWKNAHLKDACLDVLGVVLGVAIAALLIPGLPGYLLGAACASVVSTIGKWIVAIGSVVERRRRRLLED